jgi:signal transduction histidine kinase
MNRLWVRFSLVIGGAILAVILVPTAFRMLVANFPGLDFFDNAPVLPVVAQELSPETLAELRVILQAELIRTLAGVAIAGATFALLFGVWFSRSLTAPLRELEKAAQAIEAQDLSYRVPVEGSSELVAVSTAFNNMAAQLEESETLRRNLLADVAHELRNPLHVLQGNLQAILDGVYPLTPEEVARLSDQTRLLIRLVDDLHLLAQAEAHQLLLRREPADIADLVKESAAAFRSLAAARQIQLRVELLGVMPEVVMVDVARMRQALQNLLANALRHTPDGGQITVAVERLGALIQIRVQDTGSGIKAENLPLVFDRFYRIDAARSRDSGSIGLGLSIVRAIVEAHDGSVSASSAGPNQGSTFTISLPLSG